MTLVSLKYKSESSRIRFQFSQNRITAERCTLRRMAKLDNCGSEMKYVHDCLQISPTSGHFAFSSDLEITLCLFVVTPPLPRDGGTA